MNKSAGCDSSAMESVSLKPARYGLRCDREFYGQTMRLERKLLVLLPGGDREALRNSRIRRGLKNALAVMAGYQTKLAGHHPHDARPVVVIAIRVTVAPPKNLRT
ncbi:hypothetical protein [Pseudovibrio exalbescens]|uniref:hypothetical protein n=1 Tax=Pseudovibrio exalbescens TaxID=197461 RepID=UPI0011AF30E8|nr:hypothetical protein [Pseudovibrio exalbescens]